MRHRKCEAEKILGIENVRNKCVRQKRLDTENVTHGKYDIWAKSASPSTKMLLFVKTEILDPSGGVLYD